MKAARTFQLTALLLVLVSVVQVGYWVFDQYSRANETVRQVRTLYSEQAAAGQALLDAGMPAERIKTLLPDLVVEGRTISLQPRLMDQLAKEQGKRLDQYLWEGGFFLLALCLCVAVISMALRAEAKVVKEQDNFLALVSHQFKTPLASLQLSLETMTLRALAPDQARTLIDRMLSDLARMEAMVSQILESARLERGQVTLKREPVQLSAAVQRVVSQLEERATADKITITVQIPNTIEVLADPLAVDVALRNILENAIAAVTPVGGGTIAVASRATATEVELTVRDSGVGFRPADRGRLFRKFTRLHPGGGSSYNGTGLGLFIVKGLMQRAGGKVSAHSDGLGRGAEFVLTWPLAVATEAAA
jgi:signal transduction histidine kinase